MRRAWAAFNATDVKAERPAIVTILAEVYAEQEKRATINRGISDPIERMVLYLV
jgi:hypothetical protein